jgi:hypothetical protein
MGPISSGERDQMEIMIGSGGSGLFGPREPDQQSPTEINICMRDVSLGSAKGRSPRGAQYEAPFPALPLLGILTTKPRRESQAPSWAIFRWNERQAEKG